MINEVNEHDNNESERVSNTHSMGEQVKILLLPNSVGKKSGTMTMVTTHQLGVGKNQSKQYLFISILYILNDNINKLLTVINNMFYPTNVKTESNFSKIPF